MKTTYFSWVLLVLTIVITVFLSRLPQWQFHLHTDVNVHYARAQHLKNNLGLVGLDGNEYQPGAIVYFGLLSIPLFFKDTFNVFLTTTFIANIFWVFALAYLYKKQTKSDPIIILALILLTQGPLYLFRFDLMVMFFVLLGFYLWHKGFKYSAVASISFAVLSKVFPLALIPYFVLHEYREKGLKSAIRIGSSFITMLVGMIILYLLIFRVSFEQLLGSWNFLKNVPVNTESIWGSLLSLRALLLEGQLAASLGAWGTFGIHPDYTLGPLTFYSSFSFLVLAGFYLWYLFTKKSFSQKYHLPLLIMLTFVTFSRTIQAQYTFWFSLFLPLFGAKSILKSTKLQVYFTLILIMNLMFQFIYPIHFNDVVYFYGIQHNNPYFWINLMRNTILFGFWFRLMFADTIFSEAKK